MSEKRPAYGAMGQGAATSLFGVAAPDVSDIGRPACGSDSCPCSEIRAFRSAWWEAMERLAELERETVKFRAMAERAYAMARRGLSAEEVTTIERVMLAGGVEPAAAGVVGRLYDLELAVANARVVSLRAYAMARRIVPVEDAARLEREILAGDFGPAAGVTE